MAFKAMLVTLHVKTPRKKNYKKIHVCWDT